MFVVVLGSIVATGGRFLDISKRVRVPPIHFRSTLFAHNRIDRNTAPRRHHPPNLSYPHPKIITLRPRESPRTWPDTPSSRETRVGGQGHQKDGRRAIPRVRGVHLEPVEQRRPLFPSATNGAAEPNGRRAHRAWLSPLPLSSVPSFSHSISLDFPHFRPFVCSPPFVPFVFASLRAEYSLGLDRDVRRSAVTRPRTRRRARSSAECCLSVGNQGFGASCV